MNIYWLEDRLCNWLVRRHADRIVRQLHKDGHMTTGTLSPIMRDGKLGFMTTASVAVGKDAIKKR